MVTDAVSTTTSSSPTTMNPPLAARIPNLPPPCCHPQLSYAEEWKKASQTVGKTIFGLAWLEPNYLVGCNSAGVVLVWRLQDEDNENGNDDKDGLDNKRIKVDEEVGSIRKYRKPIVRFQASKGKLYNVHFLDLGTSTLLGVCGNEGVLLFSWFDIENLMSEGEGDDVESCSSPEPLSQFQPYKSRQVVEINDFDYDDDYYLYGASGDDFGCYKWDMEAQTILKTYDPPRGGYLHTVQALPSSTTSGGHSILLTGGEDGVLSVWDHKQDKLIENIDIKDAMKRGEKFMNNSISTATSKPDLSSSSTHLWASHIIAPTSNWWNVCGGTESSKASEGSGGGFVTCWHAPTRSLAAGCVTRETPNRMGYEDSTLMTVANEGVVSYWSPTCMEREARVWSTPPCSYAVAVRKTDGLTAVAGVGNAVDIFARGGTKLYSLST